VSRHLQLLQAWLELQLVETSRQGGRLTPAGQDYAAATSPAFAGDLQLRQIRLQVAEATGSS
jgi:DNA-binding transcriptional LysR family regulator